MNLDGLAARVSRFDTEHGLKRLGWVVGGLLALSFAVFIARGADKPADPRLVPPAQARARIEGFGETAFRVQAPTVAGAATGEAREFCALLAETDQQHRRGLATRRDLGGYDAMVFRFPDDTTGAFWNRNVPISLSIAWFDADGRYISSTDMEPCPDVESCPLHRPSRAYRYAVEVARGGLDRLGIGPGATLGVGGACPS